MILSCVHRKWIAPRFGVRSRGVPARSRGVRASLDPGEVIRWLTMTGKSGVGSSFLPEKMNRHWITAGLPDYARKDELTRITPTPDYALAPLHPAAR